MKKIVIFGGGSGLSSLLKSLQKEDLELVIVVTISDNGGSTGKIRNYYDIPAPGDLRRCVVALSSNEELEELMNYRFDNNIQQHTIGNLILTAFADIKDNMEEAVRGYCKLLDVKETILPISNESLHLCAKMDSGVIINGESQIAKYPEGIDHLFYENEAKINKNVLKFVECADAIIFSSGSLYTSIISNLLFKELVDTINESTAKLIYVANLMTEQGETQNYTLSDHVNAINKCIGKSRITDVIVNNNFDIDNKIKQRYNKEHSVLVDIDYDNLECNIIEDNYIYIDEKNHIRHNTNMVAKTISYLLKGDDNE